ncbi:MAG: hypothetical protein R2778_11900 [Saprospiraceae bacterium]
MLKESGTLLEWVPSIFRVTSMDCTFDGTHLYEYADMRRARVSSRLEQLCV